jgi:cell division protein FtsN
MSATNKRQLGGTVIGFILGVVFGLAAALAVAVYVTKVPVPFMNKGQNRSAEHDEAEARKNKDWDPNAPLYGKNPARPASAAAAGAVVPAPAAAQTPAGPASAQVAAPAARAASRASAPAAALADPLGDLARARAAATPNPARPASAAVAAATPSAGADPFTYFVQVGAYRTAEDAEAQRAKLQLSGIETKVTEREQSGRTVFRVRAGPFERKDDADKMKERLDATGLESALVRVQR